MRRISPLLLLVAAVALSLQACNREPKPDHKGVFVLVGDKIMEVSGVTVDTEFTNEGFAINSFVGEPKIKLRGSDYYFILYGDYKPTDYTKFEERPNSRYEQSSTATYTADLTTGPVKGEPEMHKVTCTRVLGPGVYVLTVQKGDAALHFAIEKLE
jgi:hypothetical protein